MNSVTRSLGAILYELCTLEHAFQAQVGGGCSCCYDNVCCLVIDGSYV